MAIFLDVQIKGVIIITSRERVNKALNHLEPDKVPIDFGGFQSTIRAEAYEDLKEYLGFTKEETRVMVEADVAVDEEILERYQVDTRYLWPHPTLRWERTARDSILIDGWGVKLYKPGSSYYYDPVKHPLANYTCEDLKYYKYPELWNKDFEGQLYKRAEELYRNTDYFLIADPVFVGIFEQAWLLRGLENLLVDMVINKDFANRLFDIVLEQRKGFYSRFLDVVGPYVDLVLSSDDVAGQEGLIFSPRLYYEMIKPRHRELNQHIKDRADVKLFFHSCGAVRELIDDFVEIGVDVLNPVQVSASGMESAGLKRDFGEKISFWGGGCDTQGVLQFGTPEEVYNEVQRRVDDLKPGGGFVFNQVHKIQPDTPPENIDAMFQGIKDFRSYSKSQPD